MSGAHHGEPVRLPVQPDVAGSQVLLLAEHLPSTGSLRESWAAVTGLVQEVSNLGQKDPPLPLGVFAVEAWSGFGPDVHGRRLICVGTQELARCIAEQTVRGRTRVNFINVSNVLAEVVTGWDIAALGAEEARLEFENAYLQRLPVTQHPHALAMFEELAKRITGNRPAATETDKPWTTWGSPANAA